MNTKKRTSDRTPAKRKSCVQRAHERSASASSDSFPKVDTFSRSAVEAGLFPRTVGDVKAEKSAAAFTMDDSGCGIRPNDPEYVGFRQRAPSNMTTIPEQILRHYGERNFFIGWQGCALLAKHNFINKACVMPGEDAISAGWEFAPRRKDRKLVESLCDMSGTDGINLDASLLKFEFNKRCFGFAMAFPCFEEDVDMENPLVDYSQFHGKTFTGWNVIDPYWTVPEFDHRSASDPSYKDYFVPTWWRINGNGKRIHKSWCIYRVNTLIADIFKPAYYWGGVSIPQMCYERCYAADKCANEAQMLAMSKRLLVITANTKKMVNNPQYARETMEGLQWNRDNWGVLPVPIGTDVKQVDSMLTEFNQLITTQYQLFCGIVEIPSPKMVMAPLTGFANSGNYEWKVYAANLKKIQTRDMAPIIKATASIIQYSETGDARPVDARFGEIDIPTLVEQAEISYEKARADKFDAEARAVRKMASEKTAETHKSAKERIGGGEE